MHAHAAESHLCHCDSHETGGECHCNHSTSHGPSTGPSALLRPYTRLIIAFAVIVVIAIITSALVGGAWHAFMQYLMGAYFLVFGLMQTISLRRSARMLQAYDPLAKVWPIYGYIYPLLQLALAAAYFTWFLPMLVNSVALIILITNTVGVWKVIETKQTIRCGCLGASLNVPVSMVTLTENFFMIAMAVAMLTLALISVIPGINSGLDIHHATHELFHQ